MTSNRLLYRLLRQSWIWIVASIALGFSGAIFNGIGITLIIPLILTFLGIDFAGSGNFPPVFSSISSILESYPENYQTLFLLACVVISIILKNITGYINSVAAGVLTRRFTSTLRKEGFRLLLDVDLHYFSQHKLGEIINFVNAEISRVASAVRTLITISISSITILVFLVILVSLSWQLTLFAFAIIGLIAFINQYFIRFAKRISKELSAASSQYSSRAIELLSGIKLVKSVANESEEFQTVSHLIHARERAEFKSQLAFSAIAPMNEMISIFAVILLVFAGRQIYSGDITAYASVLITYLFVLTRMLPVVGQLNGARNKFAGFSASVDIVDDFLNRSPCGITTRAKLCDPRIGCLAEHGLVFLRHLNHRTKLALLGSLLQVFGKRIGNVRGFADNNRVVDDERKHHHRKRNQHEPGDPSAVTHEMLQHRHGRRSLLRQDHRRAVCNDCLLPSIHDPPQLRLG